MKRNFKFLALVWFSVSSIALGNAPINEEASSSQPSVSTQEVTPREEQIRNVRGLCSKWRVSREFTDWALESAREILAQDPHAKFGVAVNAASGQSTLSLAYVRSPDYSKPHFIMPPSNINNKI